MGMGMGMGMGIVTITSSEINRLCGREGGGAGGLYQVEHQHPCIGV